MSDIFDSIFGSDKETSINYLPEQIQDIQKTNEFRQGTMMPFAKDYLSKLGQGYNQSLAGVNRAAQQGAGYAGQVGQVLGETGESAARTGVAGLSQFFDPSYGAEQFAAAMAPIQSQYQSNLANQGAMFGGAGQLGSARQALAGQQLAGQTQSAQMQAAANVMRDLNQQRLQAGQALGQFAPQYLGQGMTAQQQRLGYAQVPTDYLMSTLGKGQQYVPGGLYQAPYPGQQSSTTSDNPSLFDIGSKILPFFISDSRLKENIKSAGQIDGVNVYTYNYVWDKKPQFGVMAQELKNTKYEDAVAVHKSGYYMVDYSKLPAGIRAKVFAQ
jgi:hypothetical protein